MKLQMNNTGLLFVKTSFLISLYKLGTLLTDKHHLFLHIIIIAHWSGIKVGTYSNHLHLSCILFNMM